MTRLPALGSDAERFLETRLKQHGVPFHREFQFAHPRKWRADFLVPPDLLIEVDGGTWTGGRHTRGDGVERDAEKQSAAAIARFRTLRCTTTQVLDDRCLDWILAARGKESDR